MRIKDFSIDDECMAYEGSGVPIVVLCAIWILLIHAPAEVHKAVCTTY